MSSEEDDWNLFTIIWLGNELNKKNSIIKFQNEFSNCDELKEYITGKTDSSIIVILSDSIPFDSLSLLDFPQICAVYNAKLVCLYCLPTMISSVDQYMQQIQEEELKITSKQSCLSYVLSLIRKQWFLIGLSFVICLAYFFPKVGKTGGYIRSEWSVKWGCIIIVFFLNGLSLQTKELVKELLDIRLHIFIQIYNLLIIPFTIYGLGLLLSKTSINKSLIIGIIIMGSTSTTISSNAIMTKNAMGNEYAALLNAIIGNILRIFISPSLIFYFMKNPAFNFSSNRNNTEGQLNYTRAIKNLSLMVLIPLFIGQIIHLLWTKQVTCIRKIFYFTELNSLALLALVWAICCTAFANGSFQRIQKKDLFILIIINAGIYLTFGLFVMMIARLPIQCWQFSKKDTVAIIFCGSMKTLPMGISLINALYGNQNQEITGLFSLPFIIYHIEQLSFGTFQALLLKNWVQKGVKKQTSPENDHTNIRSNNEENMETGEAETINIKC